MASLKRPKRTLSFAKYQAAGNDFILIDDRIETFPLTDALWIAHLCRPHLGIGADGLILLQLSAKADYVMRIFNSDGKEAKMCGNGLRCLTHFIRSLGDSRLTLSIESGFLLTRCSFQGEQVTTDLGRYHWIEKETYINSYRVHVVNTGVPHAVIFEELRGDFLQEARSIRSHPHFQPEGVNVNFARLENGKVRTRTYERGVERETLACGTGGAAVAVVASFLYGLKEVSIFPVSEQALHIKIDQDNVAVTGPVTFVFGGFVYDYRDSQRD